MQKLTHVVGLYLNPPQNALALCVDEKSQIQALDRTQPGLPLKKGRCGTMTHDYKRNGTVGELTGKRIHREVFVSVEDLQKAIKGFLAAWNSGPKPFVWTATMDSIVQKLNRCKQTLERIKPGCTRPGIRKIRENNSSRL